MDTSTTATNSSALAIPATSSNTTAPPATLGALVVQPYLPLASTSAPRPVFTPKEMTGAIVDLSRCMKEMQDTLQALI